MNFFGCQDPDITTAAVALSRSCGAGLCDRHTHRCSQAPLRAVGLGTAAKYQSARRLLYEARAVAEHDG
ncbi:hypothetical protein [Streptomyces sp. NPDC026659]|uniref:hypothetical protein n=1 Tax=Streptomyces sp. NPDC026659 TaxID=3155123 RepID=UPI0033C47E27